MAHKFGGREFKNLYTEKLLEILIKSRLKYFLLKPYRIRKKINIP